MLATILWWSLAVILLLFLLLPAWLAAYNWIRVPIAAGVLKLSDSSKIRLFVLVPVVIPLFIIYSITTKLLRWLEK